MRSRYPMTKGWQLLLSATGILMIFSAIINVTFFNGPAIADFDVLAILVILILAYFFIDGLSR